MVIGERDLFTSSDVELQYSGAAPGVAFSPSLVTTGISSGGRDAQIDENCKPDTIGLEIPVENTGEGTRGERGKDAIGVTTRIEQYYR